MAEERPDIEKGRTKADPISHDVSRREASSGWEPDPIDTARIPRDEIVRLISQFFAGPIPPPQTLEGYKNVDPSFPGLIMERAGAEQAHRHALERKQQDANIELSRKGQWFAFGFGVAVVIAAILIGVFGHPIAGPAAAGVITTIVASIMGGIYVRERLGETKKKRARDDNGDEE